MNGRDHSSQSGADGRDGEIDVLRSLLRLLIGGSQIGVEELSRQLKSWEEMTPDEVLEQAAADIIEIDMERGDRVYHRPLTVLPQGAGRDVVSKALIGVLFEVRDGMRSGIDLAWRITRAVSRVLQPCWYPPCTKAVYWTFCLIVMIQ